MIGPCSTSTSTSRSTSRSTRGCSTSPRSPSSPSLAALLSGQQSMGGSWACRRCPGITLRMWRGSSQIKLLPLALAALVQVAKVQVTCCVTAEVFVQMSHSQSWGTLV